MAVVEKLHNLPENLLVMLLVLLLVVLRVLLRVLLSVAVEDRSAASTTAVNVPKPARVSVPDFAAAAPATLPPPSAPDR
jgi:hypothetical protein